MEVKLKDYCMLILSVCLNIIFTCFIGYGVLPINRCFQTASLIEKLDEIFTVWLDGSTLLTSVNFIYYNKTPKAANYLCYL